MESAASETSKGIPIAGTLKDCVIRVKIGTRFWAAAECVYLILAAGSWSDLPIDVGQIAAVAEWRVL